MKISRQSLAAVLAALGAGLATAAYAQGNRSVAYVYDAQPLLVKTPFGECVRSIEWTRELAIKECDPALFPEPKPAAVAPAAAEPQVAAPAPAPTPAPAVVAAPAAAAVVAPLDSDGDGVVDSADRCPGTRSGAKVDAFGCEIAEVVVLKGVNFATNSARLTPESLATLDTVAAALTKRGIKAEVAGYTDNVGSAANNRVLSQNRAEAVRKYLIGKGVPPENLTARGYGEDNPIAENGTASGRAANRRVELHAR